MTNPNCLQVQCDYDRIKAEFRADLFDKNPGDEQFIRQIKRKQRDVIDKNGNALVPGNCYFDVDTGDVPGNSFNIDWSYEECSHLIDVRTENDEIIYSVNLSFEGDGFDNSDVIEFYVDHRFGAECKYPTKILLDNQFWVNQEDVEASKNESGNLKSEFTCDFYSDEDRLRPINSDNIVNMGDTIYGQVTSEVLSGLSYELTQVTVSDAKNNALTFNVIENGSEVAAVRSSVEDQQVTGSPLNFNWMSFGFQGLSDQNKLDIQCHVELRLNNPDPCPTDYVIQELSTGEQCVQVNKGKFK